MNYQNLIIKFFAGEISDSEMTLLKEWINLNPENRQIFNEENELWQETSALVKHGNFRTDTAWLNISSRLGLGTNNNMPVKVFTINNFRLLIAAATIAFLFAIGALSLWISGEKTLQKIAGYSTFISTKEGEKSQVLLSDSTKVLLNSGSSLQYNALYNNKSRLVKLSGEAFFDVHTNPEKPFIVHVDKMSITATGTRFNVLSYGDEDRIETTLEEGTIYVTIKGKDPVSLKSGQQIVYFRHSEKVIVREVATDTYTSWKENRLRFNDTPFEEVLARIGRKYNVSFEVTNRDLLNLKYTATIIDESIEEVMQLLKTVSPITYKIYNRTSINDKHYLKPRIVVGKRKPV